MVRRELELNAQDVYIGHKLKALRERGGQSIATVCESIGVTSGEYVEFENGTARVSAAQLLVLSRRFSASLWDVFSDMEQIAGAQTTGECAAEDELV